jgi:hypothetical protein
VWLSKFNLHPILQKQISATSRCHFRIINPYVIQANLIDRLQFTPRNFHIGVLLPNNSAHVYSLHSSTLSCLSSTQTIPIHIVKARATLFLHRIPRFGHPRSIGSFTSTDSINDYKGGVRISSLYFFSQYRISVIMQN